MTRTRQEGIAYTPFPTDLQKLEREKSRLLLEAHLLKSQMRFAEAAESFEKAAHYEDTLAAWADAQGLSELYYLHAFIALSCWAQAGDPHRALTLSLALLQAEELTDAQRNQLQNYYYTLEQRWVSWMQQWSTSAFSPA